METSNNQSLLFPVAFWDGPPQHAISSLQLGSAHHRDTRHFTRVRLQSRNRRSRTLQASPESSPSVSLTKSPLFDYSSPTQSSRKSIAPDSKTTTNMNDGRFLITGSVDGGLILWTPKFNDHNNNSNEFDNMNIPKARCSQQSVSYLDFSCHFAPSAILLRDTPSETTALALCFLEGRSAVLELSNDGYMSLWDGRGGRCFSSVKILPDDYIADNVYVYIADGVQYAIITGCSSTVLIVKLATSEIVATLEHREPVVQTVIYSTRIKTPDTKEMMRAEKLIIITTSGMISTYIIHMYKHRQKRTRGDYVISQPQPHLRSEVHITTILGTPQAPSDIVSLSLSKQNESRKLLLVMDHHWLVCSLSDYQMDFPVISSREQGDSKNQPFTPLLSDKFAAWAGGEYIEASHVILWTLRGDIYVYELDVGIGIDQQNKSNISFDDFATPLTTRCSPDPYEYNTMPPRFICTFKWNCNLKENGYVSLVKVDGNTIFRCWTTGHIERFIVTLSEVNEDFNIKLENIDSSQTLPSNININKNFKSEHRNNNNNNNNNNTKVTDNQVIDQNMIYRSKCRHSPDVQIEIFPLPILSISDGFNIKGLKQVLPSPSMIHSNKLFASPSSKSFNYKNSNTVTPSNNTSNNNNNMNIINDDNVVDHEIDKMNDENENENLVDKKLGETDDKEISPNHEKYDALRKDFASDSEWNSGNPCTASVLLKYKAVAESIVLARGYRDGTIIVNSLLSNRLRVKVQTVYSAITTLMALSIESSPIEAPLLISGNKNGDIHVYVLVTGQLLGSLKAYAPIISLYRPCINGSSFNSDTKQNDNKLNDSDKKFMEATKFNSMNDIDENVAALAPEPLHPFLVRSPISPNVKISNYNNTLSPSSSSSSNDHTKVRMRSLSTYYAHTLSYGGHVNSDNDLLFGVDTNYCVTVYSLSNMLPIQVLCGHDSPIVAVYRNEWCRYGDYIISVTVEGTVYVWILSTGQLERCLKGTYARAFLASHKLSTYQMEHLKFLPNYNNNDNTVTNNAPLLHVVPFRSIYSNRSDNLHVNILVININKLLLELKDKYRKLAFVQSEGKFIENEVTDYNLQTYNGMLSYLFEWGVDKDMDELLLNKLGFHVPSPQATFAQLSNNNRAFCILFPIHSQNTGRWEFHPRMTALHSLSLSTICMSLLQMGHHTQQVYYSRVVAHYSVILPDTLKRYVEPSIRMLASFALNENEEIHTAARLLLQGTIERCSENRRKIMIHQWTKIFQRAALKVSSKQQSIATTDDSKDDAIDESIGTEYDDQEMMAALVICLIAVNVADLDRRQHDSKVNDEDLLPLVTVQLVTKRLIRALFMKETSKNMGVIIKLKLAAELLGKGYTVWKNHINDHTALIRRLHVLSQSKHASLGSVVHRALMQTGIHTPKHFIACMGHEALDPHNDPRDRQAALISIVTLVKKYPSALAAGDILSMTVSYITRCLDPSEPTIRKSLLHPSTMALHVLVQKYSMVGFHQKKQLFAVGTPPPQSTIIIYDLRTATKWRILEGHTGTVVAVSFSPSGDVVVSYSPDESPPTVRSWRIAASGFFSGILNIQGQASRLYKLAPNEKQVTMAEYLSIVKITWPTDTTATLKREDGSTYNIEV